MKRLSMMILFLLLALPGFGQDKQIFEFGFTSDLKAQPHLIVMASINASPPAPFIFDTGFQATVVINKSYGFDTEKTGRVIRYNKSIDAEELKTLRFSISAKPDDLEVNFSNCVSMDLSSMDDNVINGKIAGIIGAGILNIGKLAIDFDQRKVRFGVGCEPGDLMTIDKNSKKIPQIIDDVNYLCPLILVNIAGNAKKLVLDTGSYTSVISEKSFRKTKGVKKSVIPAPFGMIGKEGSAHQFLLPDVGFVGVDEKDSLVVTPSPGITREAIGLQYLMNFNLLLDRASKCIWLNRRSAGPKIPGYCGFTIFEKESRYFVSSVSLDYKGDRAIFPGDEIIKEEVMPISVLRAMLNGFEGEEITMKLKRRGQFIEVKYRSVPFFVSDSKDVASRK